MPSYTPNARFIKLKLTTLAITALFITGSCSKKDKEPTRDDFVGTWTGTNNNNPGISRKMVITAGSAANALQSKALVGFNSCNREIPLAMYSSGKYLEMELVNTSDNCNNIFTVGGNGTLENGILTWTLTSSGAVRSVVTFTGKK